MAIRSMPLWHPDRSVRKYDGNTLPLPEVSASFFSDKLTWSTEQRRSMAINVSHFDFIKLIGRGAGSEVFLVRFKPTETLYALKRTKKRLVVEQQQVAHARAERDFMAESGAIQDEWVVTLSWAFQDEQHLYLVMEYVAGCVIRSRDY